MMREWELSPQINKEADAMNNENIYLFYKIADSQNTKTTYSIPN